MKTDKTLLVRFNQKELCEILEKAKKESSGRICGRILINEFERGNPNMEIDKIFIELVNSIIDENNRLKSEIVKLKIRHCELNKVI